MWPQWKVRDCLIQLHKKEKSKGAPQVRGVAHGPLVLFLDKLRPQFL